ncbi:WXG100 family type VII secretion target [Nocardia sp. NBC_00565]|uniref:WXG100 family type VII secretion target n=1 Tax=unclassified Nocardia TaxID=2637762 RepID=UPI002E8130A2|nr:WXG100 family type VII secretion target [Nocardia sp. NBC_00565]WUC00362.1 WXG100 family type VII secretion target [Nocardia sp. NBC_00565]
MSSEFTVDLDHLDDIVAKLSGLAGYIEEHLDEIDDRVATLTGTGWEGVAAQAYTEAHTQWATGAREFVEGVKDMSDAAKAAHARYTTAVDTNYKMFNQG